MLSNSPLKIYQGSGYIIIHTAEELKKKYEVDLIGPEYIQVFNSFGGRLNTFRMAIGFAKYVWRNRKSLPNYSILIFYGAEAWLAIWMLKRMLHFKGMVLLHSNGLELHVQYKLREYQHYLGGEEKIFHPSQNKLFQFAYKNVDAIITLSEYDKKFAVNNLGIPSERVDYMEPCLDDRFFSLVSTKKLPLIGYCGSWITRKGIASLKDGVSRILREYPEYRLALIGVGSDFFINQEFSQDIVDKIDLYPTISDKNELIRLYDQIKIFAFPSFCESYGLVLPEAMSRKCCIVSGPTGYAEKISADEGAIIDPPISDNLYHSIKALIDDPELLNSMSQKGYDKVQYLRWDNYRERLFVLLDAWKN